MIFSQLLRICCLLSFAFDTDRLFVDRLHVDCHVGLFRQVVALLGIFLIFLSGKLEDVVVLELHGVVAALDFVGLMSRS